MRLTLSVLCAYVAPANLSSRLGGLIQHLIFEEGNFTPLRCIRSINNERYFFSVKKIIFRHPIPRYLRESVSFLTTNFDCLIYLFSCDCETVEFLYKFWFSERYI